MALRVAVASGNWSNPAIWDGGVLPTVGDVVASNNFTVTIDQNINVDTLTNAAQSIVDAVPDMTSNTSPSGIVSASDIPNPSTNDAFRAFDNSLSTWWSGGTVNVSNPRWISYQFPNAIPINQYVIQGVSNGNEQGPKDWQFQGWNGSSWVTLHTVTGHNSNAYTSPLIGNSTAYSSYRLLITASLSISIGVVNLILYEYLGTSPAVAGGTFILNDGVTVTCTNTGNGISMTNCVTCLTYSGTTSATVNANIRGRDGCGVFCVHKTGSGTLNINGYLAGAISSSGNGGALAIQNTGIVNIVGNVFSPTNSGQTIIVSSTCTLNIVGDITSGPFNTQQTIRVNAVNTIINVTGNIVIGTSGVSGWSVSVIGVNASNVQINLVGDIDGTLGSSTLKVGLGLNTNTTVYHTGNIIGTSDNTSGGQCVSSSAVHYYDQVGYIKASMNGAGFASTNGGAISILTGPFISSPSGIQPLYVSRMHYKRTLGSYYEFRDNSTNGALPPNAPAPATRLVSPNTTIDSPIPANVRQGVNYALGTLTGTMKVPNPENVSKNVPIDNTIGTAVLSSADVWAVPTSELNEEGSIGQRLKNISTVESVGDQIVGLLSN